MPLAEVVVGSSSTVCPSPVIQPAGKGFGLESSREESRGLPSRTAMPSVHSCAGVGFRVQRPAAMCVGYTKGHPHVEDKVAIASGCLTLQATQRESY